MTPNPSVHLRQILELLLPFIALGFLLWLAWTTAGRYRRPFSITARLFRKLAKYPAVRVTVEGHCDERGTREYNLALGARRANAVKEYLVSLGVAAGRLETISYGKERPMCTESSESCYAQNRRGVTTITNGASS